MEVKNFFEHLKTKEEEKKEFFFVLQITGEVVKSAIWTVEEQKVKIISLGEEVSWSSPEELLTAADTSLSAAIERLNLPEGAEEPSRVIFGLPPSWIVEDKIVAEKMEKLKKLSQKLELKPAGFVVVPEAMIYYLKLTEGVPPTAILVGVGLKRLFLSLVNLGKINANEEVDRSDNFGADMAEGLSRFGTNIFFPPRIILYNGRERIEDLGQELMAYPWPEAEINFLHLPKIEVLTPDVDVRAVALAGGQELAQAVGVVEELPKTVPSPVKEPQLVEPAAKSLKEVETLIEIVDKKKERRKWPKWSSVNWHFRCRLPKVLGVVIFVFGLALTGLFWLYWNWPAATVVLGTESKFLEKELTIRLDPRVNEIETEKIILPGQWLEIQPAAEKSQTTTGKKITGELAKGEVRIYNNTPKEKKFSAGTVITSSSGLKFSLEEETIIASHSSALEAVPSVIVKVAAVKFGNDYNLAAGTEFTVANLAKSDFAAKNENAFGGGSSQEVAAVAVKDQENLLKALTEEMKNKAVEELRMKVSEGRELVPETLRQEVVSKEYDQKVEAEAEEINLKLKLKFSALSYEQKELNDLLDQQIGRLVPTGYQLETRKREIAFEPKSVGKEGAAVLTAKVKAGLRPEFDLEAIEKNLAGKRIDLGRSYLVNLPNVKRVEIKIRPSLPTKIATFPHRQERIAIQVIGE